MTDINIFARKILSDKRFRKEAHRKFVDDCYDLNGVDGNIHAAVLADVIVAAKRNRKIRTMLYGILWFADGASISDENFQLILSFPKKARSNLLFRVAHAELSFSQMQIVNRLSGEYEAFAPLFDIICKNDCFDRIDMMQLLRENKGEVTKLGLLYCIEDASSKYGSNDKIAEAVKWAEQLADPHAR